MGNIYTNLKDYFEEITEHYQALAVDGKFSFGDAMLLMGKASASFIQVVERFTEIANGPDKKQAVLEALDHFYDDVIKPLDLQGVPNLIEPIVDSAIKQLVLTIASASIDTLVAVFNKTGWNPEPLPGPQAYSSPYMPAEGEELKKEVVFF
jgi:hypothetical protein